MNFDVSVEESSSHDEADHYAAAAPEESESSEAEPEPVASVVEPESVAPVVEPEPAPAPPRVVATRVPSIYRPEPVRIAPRAYHHHPVVPVLVHDHDSSDDEPNVTINIYNGNGATMGFGANLECVPRVGECRPQCPEVVYNEYDNSLWFTW